MRCRASLIAVATGLDGRLVKPPVEIALSRRVRDPLRPQRIEIDLVLPAQFEVLGRNRRSIPGLRRASFWCLFVVTRNVLLWFGDQ
jgi:hypothetical protein